MEIMRHNAKLDSEMARRGSDWPITDMVERFMDDYWRSPDFATDVEVWMPRVDVSENDREFRIAADIPGVEPKDVTVEVVGNTLQISGRSTAEEREETDQYYRAERQSGEFMRSFALPSNADTQNINAEIKNGSIKLIIPKTAQTEPERREIKIKHADQLPKHINRQRRDEETEFSL